MVKKVKAWAIVTQRGVLTGGGSKDFGYTELDVYSTRQGAKKHLSAANKHTVVPCEITYKLTKKIGVSYEEASKNIEVWNKRIARGGYTIGPLIKGKTKKESWLKCKIALYKFNLAMRRRKKQ